MYTLKIKWYRYDYEKDPAGTLEDETTLFISCEQVAVHGEITDIKDMSSWAEGDFFDYRTICNKDGGFKARLIGVEHAGKTCWYLTSYAWVIGPEGKTIENLVP